MFLNAECLHPSQWQRGRGLTFCSTPLPERSRRADSNRGPLHYEGRTSEEHASTRGHGRACSRWKLSSSPAHGWTRAPARARSDVPVLYPPGAQQAQPSHHHGRHHDQRRASRNRRRCGKLRRLDWVRCTGRASRKGFNLEGGSPRPLWVGINRAGPKRTEAEAPGSLGVYLPWSPSCLQGLSRYRNG
jgi:hypothetical protein